MSSHRFLPSIAACWMSLNPDSDICHLTFPLSLVSSVVSEPASQPDPYPTACRHVDGSQEDTTKGTPAQARALPSCEARWGHLTDPHQPSSLNLDQPHLRNHLSPATHLGCVGLPTPSELPQKYPQPHLSSRAEGGKGRRKFDILTSPQNIPLPCMGDISYLSDFDGGFQPPLK